MPASCFLIISGTFDFFSLGIDSILNEPVGRPNYSAYAYYSSLVVLGINLSALYCSILSSEKRSVIRDSPPVLARSSEIFYLALMRSDFKSCSPNFVIKSTMENPVFYNSEICFIIFALVSSLTFCTEAMGIFSANLEILSYNSRLV
jgi:hypothetical protein